MIDEPYIDIYPISYEYKDNTMHTTVTRFMKHTDSRDDH